MVAQFFSYGTNWKALKNCTMHDTNAPKEVVVGFPLTLQIARRIVTVSCGIPSLFDLARLLKALHGIAGAPQRHSKTDCLATRIYPFIQFQCLHARNNLVQNHMWSMQYGLESVMMHICWRFECGRMSIAVHNLKLLNIFISNAVGLYS